MSATDNAPTVTGDVLVVDDTPADLKLLANILGRAGHTVQLAADGELALRSVQAKRPDLILLDIRMPGLDGFEVCRRLKADAATRDIPVIFVSSLTETADKAKGFKLGAVDYLPKPVAAGEVLARVGNHLALSAVREQLKSQNSRLHEVNDELRDHRERLEERVAERTAALTAEITERKRAEETLAASEARYRSYVDVTGQIGWVTNPDGEFVEDVPSLRRFSGQTYEEAKGSGWAKALHPDDLERTLQAWNGATATKSAYEVEYRMRRHDGVYRHLLARGFPVTKADGSIREWVGTCLDITDRKRAEEERTKLQAQLLQSQKMEAIGSLAGGVAHDFNNLLSVILIYTGLAIDGARDGDPFKDDLLEVRKAAKRAESLTRQLLAFSRRQVLQPALLSLNDTAAGLEKMLRRILGEDIDFVQVLAPDLGIVNADPGQLEQVLMNLVVNARDAMAQGGKLTIETANVEVGEEYAASHVGVTAGPYVVLAVTDTGGGMDAQTKGRLFEPFFTTKPKGKGTGLGLAMVYGIVKQSGGHISVYSELGHGTTFKIHLPRELSVTSPTPVPKRPTAPTRTTGTETILVAEDEEALRKVAVRTLSEAGYTVLDAADGDEALATGAQHLGEIHLLLTDVVMPQMSGRALALALAKTRPTLKVVYMSGYTDNAIVHHGVLDAGTRFLAKPFTAADLTRKVREVLDEGSPGLADGSLRAVEPATAVQQHHPLDKEALRALPPDLLGKLRKAVIAARYDDIVEIVESIRLTAPEVAAGLRPMADLFDYEGMRDLLGPSVEGETR